VHIAIHYQAHCHTLPCTLSHTAARTAAHCRIAAHCHALLHPAALSARESILIYIVLFYVFYFHNTHRVLVGLSQGVDSLAILCYVISFYFILVYLYSTHQVLVELLKGLVALLF
jgi:hypothetical protein